LVNVLSVASTDQSVDALVPGMPAAAAAIEEAEGIAGWLRCQPLLDRAADLVPADSRIRA
jgi:hypothetical protein